MTAGKSRGRQLRTYTADYVVFDLETTGISVSDDEVIEISAIKVRNGQAVDEFTSMVNPGRPIPWSASRVNGITDNMVREAPCFADVLKDFLTFAGGDVLVGHNIHTFDMKFLYRDAERFYGRIPDNNYIDTLTIARTCLPKLPHHRLTDLAAYYGISIEGAHRALNDCYMNQQVFERLAKEPPRKDTENGLLAAGDWSGRKICPRCGRAMKQRDGKFGRFWGCSGYPDCRYTERR